MPKAKVTAIPQKPRELTEEEKIQQINRIIAQRRETLVQGVTFNLAGNPSVADAILNTPEVVAEKAVAFVDAVMERLYVHKQEEKAE